MTKKLKKGQSVYIFLQSVQHSSLVKKRLQNGEREMKKEREKEEEDPGNDILLNWNQQQSKKGQKEVKIIKKACFL